jgi:serine/threonine protein kinase
MTLGATTLLHQAYLEMAQKNGAALPDRARFMGYAARVMRGLIIDYARNRRAQKRGGQFEQSAAGPVSDLLSCRRVVGPYTLISPVGQGGMGNVWLAERSDGRFQRCVAVKFLNFAVAGQNGASGARPPRLPARPPVGRSLDTVTCSAASRLLRAVSDNLNRSLFLGVYGVRHVWNRRLNLVRQEEE